MGMPAQRDLLGDVAHLHQIEARAFVVHEGAGPGTAADHAFVHQLAQGPVHRHAADAEHADQFLLGRDAMPLRPLPGHDPVDDVLLHALVERRRVLVEVVRFGGHFAGMEIGSGRLSPQGAQMRSRHPTWPCLSTQ